MPRTTPKTLFIIDGNSLLHRAWHAIPPLTNKNGTVVNAVYGFAMVIEKLIREEKPTHMAVCWDIKGATFRDEIFEDYKAGRPEKEQELYDQISLIQDLLTAWGVASFGVEGYEADDLIATIAERERKNPETKTVIVTGDLDALQLVDALTDVRFFVKGLSQTKTYNPAAVRERYGFGPEHIVDYKGLAGDTSDNIPGVKGIGAKTATQLITMFGGVDAIYTALKKDKLDGLSAGVIEKLRIGEKSACMSVELATVKRDVPFKWSMKAIATKMPDMARIKELYVGWEFSSLLRKLNGESTPAAARSPKLTNGSSRIHVGTSPSELHDLFGDAKEVALDVLVQPADLFGTSFGAIAVANSDQVWVLAHPSRDQVRSVAEWCADKSLITADLKALAHVVAVCECEPSWKGVDLSVAAYLLGVGDRQQDLDAILTSLLGSTVPDRPRQVDSEKDVRRLAEVVGLFPKAAREIKRELKDQDMEALYAEI